MRRGDVGVAPTKGRIFMQRYIQNIAQVAREDKMQPRVSCSVASMPLALDARGE